MADIFISYSSNDSRTAQKLAEDLTSVGLSCWIDSHRIEAASNWSASIVDAITDCLTFVVLLSPSSITSHNVIKEVSLASEKRKKILPLDIEPVSLPREIEYQLAGIQRTSVTNIDDIVKALSGLGLQPTAALDRHRITKTETDNRKSLIIFPFEDLSPTQDNAWFADGLAGELIDLLGKIKSLRILDRKTSLGLRNVKLNTMQIGREFNTRFFVEGTVRKYGDQIKISVSLLDIETGDHLWQESFKGIMEDIFELQENVAAQVVEGLKLHLTNEEKACLAERETSNPEAYELYLKGKQYFSRQTKESFDIAYQLLSDAINVDAEFYEAYVHKANVLVALYRFYDQNPALLDEAEELCHVVMQIKPEFTTVNLALMKILIHRGKWEEARRIVEHWAVSEPDNFDSQFALAYFYNAAGEIAKTIPPYEAALRLKPNSIETLWNIVISCKEAGQQQECSNWSQIALQQVERHLRIHPNDESALGKRAVLLFYSGKKEESYAVLLESVDEKSPRQVRDGRNLYNAACLFEVLGYNQDALRVFRRAVRAGFRNIDFLNEFLTSNSDGVASLAGTAEYEEVKELVAGISNTPGTEMKW